jgi:hypothetical protein
MNVARLTGWIITACVVGAVGLALYADAQFYVPENREPRALDAVSGV